MSSPEHSSGGGIPAFRQGSKVDIAIDPTGLEVYGKGGATSDMVQAAHWHICGQPADHIGIIDRQ